MSCLILLEVVSQNITVYRGVSAKRGQNIIDYEGT